MSRSFGPPYHGPDEFSQVNGFPRYSEQEMARRHAFVHQLMSEHELDAVLVGGATAPLETAIQYFCNWPSQVQSYLLFTQTSPPQLVARLWNHLPDARRISVVDDVTYGGDTPAEQASLIADLLDALGARRVGLIGVVPHADLMRLFADDRSLMDMNTHYQSFRLVKSEEEMVFVRVASRMNDAAIEALASTLRPGVNELEVARIVEEVYLAHRGWNLIHFSMSTPMTSPELVVPHQYHPDRVLQAGDVFVTEISTTFWGYAGQILRTFTIGTEPDGRFARLHDVAHRAYESITQTLRAGTTVGEVLDAADVIDREGLDIWDDLVHGFGGAYLPPVIRTRASRGATHDDDVALPQGTLLVVQPNVIDGRAGVQVGNSMWLTENGVEITQNYPTQLIVCP